MSEQPVQLVLVDDEPEFINLIKIGLEKCAPKVELQSFENPDTVLEQFRSSSRKIPSVILLDYYLPGMNGVELLREIRKLEGFKKVPIYILSSTAQGTKLSDLPTGLSGYFQKPGNFDELVALLNYLLSRK